MKIIKHFAVAIYPLLFALVGCHLSPKPIFKVPPSAQDGYVDGGGTLQWPATGEPFEIFWSGLNPCLSNDDLASDGTTTVTCHAMNVGKYGGSYIYDVGRPSKEHKLEVQKGIFNMHVGPCTNCLGIPIPVGGQELSSSLLAGGSGNEVRISCPSPGGASTPTLVVPLAGPSGLNVKDFVAFEYIGQNPPPSQQPLTLTFQPNYCTGLSSPYQIQGGSAFCQASSAGATPYTAQSDDCASTRATLTANTP